MKELTYRDMIDFFRVIGIPTTVLDEETTNMPTCKHCGKKANEIREYIDMAKEDKMPISQYIREGEGTYNPLTNKFYCTDCYIDLGCPLGKA
ncbi:MAG: hypothetical protein ACRCX2_10055 [Paraclostridium sp.]